jgi:hypothetical protein
MTIYNICSRYKHTSGTIHGAEGYALYDIYYDRISYYECIQ